MKSLPLIMRRTLPMILPNILMRSGYSNSLCCLGNGIAPTAYPWAINNLPAVHIIYTSTLGRMTFTAKPLLEAYLSSCVCVVGSFLV